MLEKLRPKSGDLVAIVDAPTGLEFATLPGVRVVDKAVEEANLYLIFVRQVSDTPRHRDLLLRLRANHASVWFAYPKKSGSIKSDISRDMGWDRVMQQDWRPVSQVSLGKDWSALRFKWESPEIDYVAEQYAGSRARLFPVYEAVLAYTKTLGDDIITGTRKNYVAVSRKSQFLVLQPSGRCLQVGLRLKGSVRDETVLKTTRVGGGSISHVIELTNVAEFDHRVRKWIDIAYHQNNS